MRTGTAISGLAHGALIAWALFGGLFLRSHDVPRPAVSEVSLITAEDFAALTAPPVAPSLQTDLTAPAPPPQPEEPPVPAPTAPPAPEPRPVPGPAASPPPDRAPRPDPAPAPPPAPEPPQPQAVPTPDPMPAPPPEPDALVGPAAPAPGAQDLPPSPSPVPRPAERIAADPNPEPPPATVTADAPVPEVAPADEVAVAVEPRRPPAAPPPAAPEIVTEAERPAGAPVTSLRPKARPERFALAAESPRPVTPATPATPPRPTPPAGDSALEAALAEALAGQPAQAPAASGPPLTAGEKGDFAIAVRRCWVVDPGSEAARITVDVGFSMTPDGRVVGSSLRLIRASEGSEAARQTAYEAARRAILRCGTDGYILPAEKYAQWRDVEITFNPENTRIR